MRVPNPQHLDAFFLGCFCTCTVLAAMLIFFPSTVRGFEYQVRFWILDVTKERIAEYALPDRVISIFRERGREHITMKNVERLEGIVRKAVADFPEFFSRQHTTKPLRDFGIRKGSITFVGESTYETRDAYFRRGSSGMTQGLKMYIACEEKVACDILDRRGVIRHEIYHYLCTVYGIGRFENEEAEAVWFSWIAYDRSVE